MKLFFITAILTVGTLCLCFSQTYAPVTIETPNQTPVQALTLTSNDMTSTQKNDYKNFWLNCYNNRIIFKGEATYSYNCHAYAWHISEGGSQVWINTPNDDKYWDDFSYVEVSSQIGSDKISFGGPCNQYWTDCSGTYYTNPCDHSAESASTYGFFISKWGKAPLFLHHKDDCPYSTEDIQYYTKVRIQGADLVCFSGSVFSLNVVPSEPTLNWSTSSNLQVYSGQGTNSPTIKAKYSSSYGEGWVQVNYITTSGTIA
jgi:hypothetical protein